MARFEYRKSSKSGIKLVLALCIFVAVIVIFFCGINSLSSTAESKEKASLENAVSRGITYCYATEGSYPDSLEYIKENYGLVYDESKYFVDYRPRGENILPDVTIIELEEGK